MDQAISGYPIRRLLCLLFTVTFATGSGIAMQFLRIQYAYQVFVAEAKLPSNSSAPTPCSPSNSTRDPAIVTKFEWVQSQTAYVSTVYSLVAGILGLLSIIPIGYLADRKGRKLAIIVAWAGTYLEILISCLAVILKLPVYVLFIGSVPAGLAGNGLIAVQTQVYTGLADISIEHDPANNDSAETSKPLLDPARHRLILMGSFDAAIGLVYAAVTYAVGDLISSIGFVVPTALAITFATLCWIFVFFLPKTDAHQISRREDEEVLDDTVEVWEEEGEVEVASPTLISRVKSFCGFLHPVAFLGVSVIFITSFTIYSDADVATLYLMGHPFCWNANQVGMFMGLRTGTSAIFSSVVFLSLALCFRCTLESTPVSKADLDGCTASVPATSTPGRYNKRVLAALTTAISLLTLSRLVFGVAWLTSYPLHDVFAWSALGIGVIAFYNPFMKSILTGSVRIDEQGRLLSTYAFCEVTGMLCGTTLQPMFYAATLAAFPGAVFLFSSGLLFVGVCFVLTISFLVLRGRVR